MIRRCFILTTLAIVLLLGCCFTTDAHAATITTHPIQHSIQKVNLQIVDGRIFFIHNAVTCSHLAKPCFILQYVGGNYGDRPLWLNNTSEYILQPHQSWPFTFSNPGVELFTLFKNSIYWKLRVIVS